MDEPAVDAAALSKRYMYIPGDLVDRQTAFDVASLALFGRSSRVLSLSQTLLSSTLDTANIPALGLVRRAHLIASVAASAVQCAGTWARTN